MRTLATTSPRAQATGCCSRPRLPCRPAVPGPLVGGPAKDGITGAATLCPSLSASAKAFRPVCSPESSSSGKQPCRAAASAKTARPSLGPKQNTVSMSSLRSVSTCSHASAVSPPKGMRKGCRQLWSVARSSIAVTMERRRSALEMTIAGRQLPCVVVLAATSTRIGACSTRPGNSRTVWSPGNATEVPRELNGAIRGIAATAKPAGASPLRGPNIAKLRAMISAVGSASIGSCEFAEAGACNYRMKSTVLSAYVAESPATDR